MRRSLCKSAAAVGQRIPAGYIGLRYGDILTLSVPAAVVETTHGDCVQGRVMTTTAAAAALHTIISLL